MLRWNTWIKQHTLAANSAIFFSMLAASLGMYLSAEAGSVLGMALSLGLFVFSNLVALII